MSRVSTGRATPPTDKCLKKDARLASSPPSNSCHNSPKQISACLGVSSAAFSLLRCQKWGPEKLTWAGLSITIPEQPPLPLWQLLPQ